MDLSERSTLLDDEEEDTDSSGDEASEGEEEEGDEGREREKRTTEGRTATRGIVSAYQRGDSDRGRMNDVKNSPYSSYSYEDTHPKLRQTRAFISRNQRIDEDYNIEEAVDLSTSFLR